MRGRYVLRPKARGDIREIADHIAADNLEDSDRFIDEVFNAFQQLAGMPLMGSARRFRRPSLQGLRLWPIPRFEKHLIIYRPRKDGIEVIRVLHGARNIERVLAS